MRHPNSLEAGVDKIIKDFIARMTTADKQLLLSARGQEVGAVGDRLARQMNAYAWVDDMDGWYRALADLFVMLDEEADCGHDL